MQALVKEKPEPGITLKEVPAPTVERGEVNVRIAACGISGSEVSRYRWANVYHAGAPKDMTRVLPRIMGHEFAGTIAQIGKGVAGWREGDRVVVQGIIGCGACSACDAGEPNHCGRRVMIGVDRNGGLAEYVSVPAANVYKVPDGVSLDAIAMLQPFAIAAYALELAGIRAGDRIGVWGVGQIGVSVIQIAQLMGATVEFAIGRDQARLRAAHDIGAIHTFSIRDGDAGEFLASRFSSQKLDAVFEVSGNVLGVTSALAILRKRGNILAIGNPAEPVSYDLQQAIIDQINLLTVRAYSLNAWRRALALFGRVQEQQQSVLPIICMPLRDGVRAFERAASGEGGAAKFVLVP